MQKEKTFLAQLTVPMKRIHLGIRDNAVPFVHWQNISDSFKLYDKPTVLWLPGSNVYHPKSINGILKSLEKSLQIDSAVFKDIPIRLMGAYYDRFNINEHLSHLQARENVLEDTELISFKQKNHPEYEKYCTDFFNRYFRAIFYKDGGKKISIKEIIQRLQNITIISHCYGSLIAFELERLMQNEMRKIGYSDNQCKKLQKYFTIINIAPRVPIGNMHSTVIHVSSLMDREWMSGWKREHILTFLQMYAQQKKWEWYHNHLNLRTESTGILFSFSGNEILLSVPRVSCSLGMEHGVLLKCHSENPFQDMTVNAQTIYRFIQAFFKLKRQSLFMTLSQFVAQWQKTQSGQFFCENGKSLMADYRFYLKKCQISRTFLPQCVEAGNQSAVLTFIKQWYIPLDLKDKNGFFPIFIAIQNRNIPMMSLLLKNMPYNQIFNLHHPDTQRNVMDSVFQTKNEDLIIALCQTMEIKNTCSGRAAFYSALNMFCYECLSQNKPIKRLLPLLHNVQHTDIPQDVLELKNMYTLASFYSNETAQENQKNILYTAQNVLYSKKILSTPTAVFLMKRLKQDNAPQEFMDMLEDAYTSMLGISSDCLKNMITRYLYCWSDKAGMLDSFLRLLLPLSYEQEQKYLAKVYDYLLYETEKSVSQRIIKRLTRRYQKLIAQQIDTFKRERIS